MFGVYVNQHYNVNFVILQAKKMHPDLSPHLHSDECNAIIKAYKQCHEEHSFKKFLGHCNDLDRALNKCLTAEYQQKRQANKHGKKWKDKLYQSGQEKKQNTAV